MVAKRRGSGADSTPTVYTTLHGADQTATPDGEDSCHEPRIGRRPSRSMEHAMEPGNTTNPEIGTRQNALRGDAPRSAPGAGRLPVRRSDCRDSRRDACLAWRRARAWARHDVRRPARNHGWNNGSGGDGQARRCDGRLAAGRCRCHRRATKQDRDDLQGGDQRSGTNAFATHAGAQAVAAIADTANDRSRQVEQLRVQQMQLGETASRRITQAILDAADVLTVVQRTQLAQKLQERHHHGGGF